MQLLCFVLCLKDPLSGQSIRVAMLGGAWDRSLEIVSVSGQLGPIKFVSVLRLNVIHFTFVTNTTALCLTILTPLSGTGQGLKSACRSSFDSSCTSYNVGHS